MDKLYDTYFNTLTEDPIYNEDGQLIVIENDVPCPLCRQNIGNRDDWKYVDEAITKMKNDLNAMEKRAQVSDLNYRDRLTRKDLELQEVKRTNEAMKLQLQELDFKLKLKTSRLKLKEQREYNTAKSVRRLAKECQHMVTKMTNVFDEDIIMSEEEEVIQLN